MSDDIIQLERFIGKILRDYSQLSHIEPQKRKELCSFLSCLNHAVAEAEALRKNRGMAVMDGVANFSDFAEVTGEFSDFVKLENELRSQFEKQQKQRLAPRPNLQSFLRGIPVPEDGLPALPFSTRTPSARWLPPSALPKEGNGPLLDEMYRVPPFLCIDVKQRKIQTIDEKEITKYKRVAQSIISYPSRDPQKVTITIDEYVITNHPGKSLYEITVDGLTRDRIYANLCLVPASTLQKWTNSYSLIRRLRYCNCLNEMILREIDYAKTSAMDLSKKFKIVLDNKHADKEIMNYLGLEPPPFREEYSYRTSWLPPHILKKSIEAIKKVFSQKVIPQWDMIEGELFQERVYSFYNDGSD